MMLGQQVDTTTHLVYVNNYKASWKAVGAKLGITDQNGVPYPGNIVCESSYLNSNNVKMPAIKLDGKSLTVYVVDGIINGVKDVPTMLAALNHFHVPAFEYGLNKFAGKFSSKSGQPYTIYDKLGRSISLNINGIKDIRGIYDLMVNLEFDNGKFMEPLIHRYVYTVKQMPSTKQRGIPVVGYFDLEEYLRIMKDDRANLFTGNASRFNSLLVIEMNQTPGRIMLRDIAVNGTAMLLFDGFRNIIETKKVDAFRPIVVMTKTPFTLPETSHFPWHKIKYGKMTIFCTPMMSKLDMWEHVQGGVNLLSKFF